MRPEAREHLFGRGVSAVAGEPAEGERGVHDEAEVGPARSLDPLDPVEDLVG